LKTPGCTPPTASTGGLDFVEPSAPVLATVVMVLPAFVNGKEPVDRDLLKSWSLLAGAKRLAGPGVVGDMSIPVASGGWN